ncbi:uncharacterized protein LOC129121113 [Agelaius phoeniceus]|uniref:uncharacterized protein LOC129121113 n=1 Tax=Agelaius phoeniceus TaxID=39638 RepID=UPI00405526E9
MVLGPLQPSGALLRRPPRTPPAGPALRARRASPPRVLLGAGSSLPSSGREGGSGRAAAGGPLPSARAAAPGGGESRGPAPLPARRHGRPPAPALPARADGCRGARPHPGRAPWPAAILARARAPQRPKWPRPKWRRRPEAALGSSWGADPKCLSLVSPPREVTTTITKKLQQRLKQSSKWQTSSRFPDLLPLFLGT